MNARSFLEKIIELIAWRPLGQSSLIFLLLDWLLLKEMQVKKKYQDCGIFLKKSMTLLEVIPISFFVNCKIISLQK